MQIIMICFTHYTYLPGTTYIIYVQLAYKCTQHLAVTNYVFIVIISTYLHTTCIQTTALYTEPKDDFISLFGYLTNLLCYSQSSKFRLGNVLYRKVLNPREKYVDVSNLINVLTMEYTLYTVYKAVTLQCSLHNIYTDYAL